MIKGQEFKRLLIEKFGSVKDAAERIGTTEQNLYKLIRNNNISTKILDKLSKAMRVSQAEVLKQIGTSNTSTASYNVNTITNEVNVKEPHAHYETDIVKQLQQELEETKKELAKTKDELLEFYRKELGKE